MVCAVVQFIKGAWDTGERRLLTTHFGELWQFYAMGEGFTWETQEMTLIKHPFRSGIKAQPGVEF